LTHPEDVRKAGCIMFTSEKLTKTIHLPGFRYLPSASETAKVLKGNIEENLKKGFIRPSESPAGNLVLLQLMMVLC